MWDFKVTSTNKIEEFGHAAKKKKIAFLPRGIGMLVEMGIKSTNHVDMTFNF
jgi:hypothetical protein